MLGRGQCNCVPEYDGGMSWRRFMPTRAVEALKK